MSTVKTCARCELTLPIAAFNYRDRAHTKLQSYCRSCSNLAWQTWYSKKSNSKSHRQLVSQRRKRRIALHRELVREAKSVPCRDCGGSFPTYVMDFDHLGNKDGEISRMVFSVGAERLEREISKCEVVCANCHRVRTHGRQPAS